MEGTEAFYYKTQSPLQHIFRLITDSFEDPNQHGGRSLLILNETQALPLTIFIQIHTTRSLTYFIVTNSFLVPNDILKIFQDILLRVFLFNTKLYTQHFSGIK